MKRWILVISLLVMTLSAPITALASNISNAIYRGTITITNVSASTINSVATNMTLSSPDLISMGYADATLTNVAIRNAASADVPFMPGWGANPWMMWVPAINGNAVINYNLYTGGPSMSSTKYYFPDVNGMTVNDAASLELGNNGVVDFVGWIDTSNPVASHIVANKTNAFSIISGNMTTGNVTAILTGNLTVPNSTVAANTWANAANTRDYDTTTKATEPVAATSWSDYLILGKPSANISAIRVWVSHTIASADLIEVGVSPNGAAWTTVFSGTPTSFGADWTVIAVDSQPVSQIRMRMYNANGVVQDEFIHEIQYLPFTALPISGVPSGAYTATLRLNGTNAWLTLAGSATYVSANATVFPVQDNSNNIQIGSYYTTPYMQTAGIDVGGVAKGSWNWVYAATFPDQTGNGNTATPTFPTQSTNSNVTAALTSFGLLNAALAPPYTVTNPTPFYSTNVTTSGNFTYGNVTGSGLPGSGLIDDSARAAGVPNSFLWGLFGGLALMVGGLLISGMSRYWGAGNGELIARIIWGCVIIGVLVTLGKFDMWMVWFYLILTIASALASRHNEVGAYFSELNFIGFLSMAEIGMVVINRILEGSFLHTSDVSQVNNYMFTQQFTILNVFTLPIVNFSFFTQGLPNLLKWNYTMFGGNAQMIQYLLYALTAIMGFIIFGLVIGTLSHYFTK